MHLLRRRRAKVGHSSEVAYHCQSHVVLYQVGGFTLDCDDYEVHQSVHLLLRTVPVFGRESVKCQVLYADFRSGFGNLAHSIYPFHVALRSVEAACTCSTSVAVHDDGYVTRKSLGVYVVVP